MVNSRLRMILTIDELDRINISQDLNNEITIIVDVHGMTCIKARKLINNIINVIQVAFQLIIIHGYNHGTAIKDMLANNFSNSHIRTKYTDSYNYGVTHMLIAA